VIVSDAPAAEPSDVACTDKQYWFGATLLNEHDQLLPLIEGAVSDGIVGGWVNTGRMANRKAVMPAVWEIVPLTVMFGP
jgi:hypothetical protein